ncbi:MAG TPA: response regulator [Gemmataceae bacterium]|nr:response regulator [Gemmataceae bacterium]
MLRSVCRFGIGFAFLIALLSPAPAQDGKRPPKGKPKEPPRKEEPERRDDYREFFKKPETVKEYWRALKFEMEVGRPDLAARHLHGLLSLKPTDEQLLEIEEQEGGLAPFLALGNLRKWDDNPKADAQAKKDIQELITAVSAALKNRLGNRERLAVFARRLASDDPDERSFALKELYRSGALAIPPIIDVLREAKGDDRLRVLEYLPKLGRDTVPPLVAALDIDDNELRFDLLDVLKRRGAVEAVPFLWHLAGSPKLPAALHARAKEVLAYLLETTPGRLQTPKVALTREAERYYRHQVRFEEPERVVVWRWDGKQIVSGWPKAPTIPASKAEEHYGLRFAREALDIDPGYRPAQLVFLALALEKSLEPAGNDSPLGRGPTSATELLTKINPDLAVAVLERALTDQRVGVILGTAKALGDLGEVRANRPSGRGEPALVRALNYPDRRVQFVAADALLRIPGPPSHSATHRVVDVLRRQAASDPAARVLVADADRDRANLVAGGLKKAGFEAVVAGTGREAMQLLHKSADIDAVFVDAGIALPELPFLLGQLRGDPDAAVLPVFVTVPPFKDPRRAAEVERKARRTAENYRDVRVMLATTDPATLQRLVVEGLAAEMGRPLSEAERKGGAAAADRVKRLLAERMSHIDRALVWLGKIATGQVPGYDPRPAAETLIAALREGKGGREARQLVIEAVGRLPGPQPQRELAAVLLDPMRPAPLRLTAATELLRHVQQHGPTLAAAEVRSLADLAAARDTPADLRGKVALVLTALRPDARTSGDRLRGYTPVPPGGK